MNPAPQPPISLRYGHSRLGAVILLSAIPVFYWLDPISKASLIDWFVFALLMALASVAFGETEVFLRESRVIRVWRWLGLLTLRRRGNPLAEFGSVRLQHLSTTQGSYWHVGLVDLSGRFVRFQSFLSFSMGAPCGEANNYASQLAGITGLPIVEN